MIGKLVSHYKILEELGRGGMGVVYKAEDTKLQRTVALKFVHPNLTRDEKAKLRFIQEARAASSLDHPNICTIHEIDETDRGQMFIVMACYKGKSLKSIIDTPLSPPSRGELKGGVSEVGGNPLPVDDAIEYAIQIAEGLSRTHEAGIMHRDMKPANIMVTDRGEVKIVDFGLAKLAGETRQTGIHSTLGTVAYMSPEQAESEETDQRADIWALGVILYEMLTGQKPFQGEADQAIIYSIVNEEAQPVAEIRAEVPEKLERIVHKSLAKNPEERYQKIDDLLAELENYKLHSAGITAKSKTYRILYPIVAFLLTCAIAVWLYLAVWPTEPEAPTSIAVLPLETIGDDSEQDWFADAMTEALISDLARIGGLRIIARASVMQYKGSTKPMSEIAKDLSANYLVEGSVLNFENQVKISLRLLNVQKNEYIWAQDREAELTDLLPLQGELARSLATQIKVQLTSRETSLLTDVQPVDPEVYKNYLKGKYFFSKRGLLANTRALPHFEEAVARDSTYGPAYAGIANSFIFRGGSQFMPTRQAFAKAKEAAIKALELDENLAEAHTALALLHYRFDYDFEAAEQRFKKAIRLNPSYATGYHWYSEMLAFQGRFDEALLQAKMAIEIDPISPSVNVHLGRVYLWSKDYDRALAQIENAQILDPYYWSINLELMHIYARKGMINETLEAYSKLLEPHPPTAVSNMAAQYVRLDMKEQARKMLADFAVLAEGRGGSRMGFAAINAALGEKKQALDYLEMALNDGEDFMFYYLYGRFDNLRSEPEFIEILNRIGLRK